MDLKPGDKIWVGGPLGTRHYGIFAGWYLDQNGVPRPFVIHNSKVQGGVVVDVLERFSGGTVVTIEARAAEGFEQVVVDRAFEYYGKKYDLLAFNCEHLVNMAQTGEHKSQQLRNSAWGLSAIFAFGLLAFGGSDRPRYDRNVGRYRDRSGRFVAR